MSIIGVPAYVSLTIYFLLTTLSNNYRGMVFAVSRHFVFMNLLGRIFC